MRSLLILGFFVLQFFFACGNDETPVNTATPVTDSENEDDAARNFLRSVLDQDFNKARTFIINDTLNNQYLNATERSFKENLSQQERLNYRSASIQVSDKKMLGDTAAIVYYSNSYRKTADSLKAVKVDGRWLIDLKYSFPVRNKQE
jgi:archaellum biogenesis ATPase FlaH